MSKRKIWLQGIIASIATMALFAVVTLPSLNKKSDTVMYSIEMEEAPTPGSEPPAGDMVPYSHPRQSEPTPEWDERARERQRPPLETPSWGDITRTFVHQGIPYFFMLVQAGIGAVTAKRLRKAKKEAKDDS